MRYTTLAMIFLALTAYASEPTVQQGPNAEITYDGLHRVDNSLFAHAWADPHADWARYDKIIPGGAQFEFRAVKKNSTQRDRSSSTEFWIDDKSKERLSNEVSAVFAEEIAKSNRFTITDSRAANALIIRGGLADIVSYVPPQYAGVNEVYLTSVGEATLVLEVLDSLSGEVLYRAIERGSMERGAGTTMRVTAVTSWSEVRRLARGWGSTLRKGLDSLPTK